MPLHDSFDRLREDLSPEQGSKDRVFKMMRQKISAPDALLASKKFLEPSSDTKMKLWKKIQSRLLPEYSATLLTRIKEVLTPSAAVQKKTKLKLQLRPLQTTERQNGILKWGASFALFLLLIQQGPQLFLAPSTRADSSVTLIPTKGEVAVFTGDEWMTVTDETVLEEGAIVRTQEGQASIVLHDDGVIRLDDHTAVELHDTSDRVERFVGKGWNTVTLVSGRIWAQGLLPSHMRPIVIATTSANVEVHEGSISLTEGSTSVLEVWHRRATLSQGNESQIVLQGRSVSIHPSELARKIYDKTYAEEWTVQNLDRDAVHRKEIANLQYQRRVDQAGILPTSRFYAVKRAAEAMDVLLTFSPEEKIEKKLQQAETRFNEAAALLAQGDAETVSVPLEEYKETLLSIATVSTGTTVAQQLVEQTLTEGVADMSAVIPGDSAYPLKKILLETSVALPTDVTPKEDMQNILIADSITSLTQSMQSEDVAAMDSAWVSLKEVLPEAKNAKVELRQELNSTLQTFALTLQDLQSQNRAVIAENLLSETAQYLPPPPQPEVVPLTEEEVQEIVQGIRDSIFHYHLERSRINQLLQEMRDLNGHPDQGRILRQLYQVLPEGPENLPDRVRREIVRLQWEKAAE